MSTNNIIRLHDVTIPTLSSPGYADGLEAAFTAIENNESILANHDFIKGDRGDSVDIELILLSEHSDLLNLLKSTITNNTQPKPINGVSWDKLLVDELYIINKTELVNGVETKTPISSLYYTFIDGRFVNNQVGTLTVSDFDEEIDLSCILVYDNGEFKKLNNVFPKIYYEDGHGLCWQVNGQKTGLPVQGVPGKDGRNSDILIVKIKENVVDENGKGEVEETWNKLGNWTTIEDKESMDGYSCFALAPTEEGSTAFYAGKLTYENDGKLYVLCKPELSLQQTFDTQTFINVMQNISIKPNPDMIATPPGLFVPMKTLGDLAKDEDGNVIENQPVHIMTATSINNEVGDEQDLMTDMVVTPVSTTTLTIDDDNNVKVDKYLYVRMSDEVRKLVEAKMNVREGTFANRKLKFKLSNILLTPNVQRPITENEEVYFLTETAIDNSGRMDFNKLAPYNDHNKMIPTDFSDNIDNGIGIYAWYFDLSHDSFDPDGTFFVPDNTPEDDGLTTLRNTFPVVYTKTMTPGIGDDILWFNGLIVDEEDFFDAFPEFIEIVESGVVGSDSTDEPTPAKFMMRAAQTPAVSAVFDSPDILYGEVVYNDEKNTSGRTIRYACIKNNGSAEHEFGYTLGVLTPSDSTMKYIGDSETVKPGETLTIRGNPKEAGYAINLKITSQDGIDVDELQEWEEPVYNVCPVCGNYNLETVAICPQCGEDFNDPTTTVLVCPKCETPNPKRALTCWSCNQRLVEKPNIQYKQCPVCKSNVLIGADTCLTCGYSFVELPTETTEICPGCGTECSWPIDTIGVCNLCGYDFGVGEGKTCPNCGTVTDDVQLKNCENCNYNFYTHKVDEPTDVPEPESPSINPTVIYKLLRGTDRESLIFDKFVPIYVNSYRMDRDTSYNLNYNVNITGDEINPKRTLSVYGDINCENINVYELTATGEIKNIYTKDEIVGEKGIDLAKGKFHVDSNGNSTAITVNADNISSDSVETTTLTSNSLTVRQIDYNKNGGISKETENIKVYPIDNDHNIDIDVNKVSSISIVGKSGGKANIDSDIPILLDTDSGIYISTNNELVGYKGNTITGKTGYNGYLEDKVKYYVRACEDNSKGKTTSKYSIKNSKSIYRCARQTSLDGMTSKFGQTYIQVCNPSGYLVDYTFDGSQNNVSTTPITCNTTIDSTTLSVATTQACCKFSVGDDVKNTSATSFKLKFGKPFVFAVSMNTKCSNGNWAVLKTANSKVVFKVVVVGTDPDDNSKKIWTPTQFECGFGDGNTSWSGYEQMSKTGNKRWQEYVRTRLFAVQPSDKTFTGNYMGYKNLEVYIVPTISMRFESEDDRELIDYIGCSQFIPYDRTVSGKDKVYGIDVNTNPDNIVFTSSYVSDTQKQYISLDYEYDIEGAGFQASILDKTGLIYAYSSGAVMGLGNTPKGLGLYFYQKTSCGGDPGVYKTIALTDVHNLLETMASSYNL